MSEQSPYRTMREERLHEAAKQQAQAFFELQRGEDVRWLMGSAEGRRFMARMLRVSMHGQSVFVTNGTQNAFEQGRQDFGNWLNQLIDSIPEGPELRLQMQKEERERMRALESAVSGNGRNSDTSD